MRNISYLQLQYCIILTSIFLLLINPLKAQFTQVSTGPIATDTPNTSTGAFWGDYNRDGLPDLFIINTGVGNTNYLYKNLGGGNFTKITIGEIATDNTGNANSASWGDYDNDGLLDLMVVNGSFNHYLYKNIGNDASTWVKTLTSDPITTNNRPSNGGSWADYDNDGFLDMFVANGGTGNDQMFVNGGGSSFSMVSTGSFVNDGQNGYSCLWADYDNDRDLDLFVANYTLQNDFLYRNDGGGVMTKITTGPVVSDGLSTFGGAWGDYNNDGYLDLYITAFSATGQLYKNNGDGTFTKITSGHPVIDPLVAPWSCNWFDYDNDGDLDLLVVNKNNLNNLYRNEGGGVFTKITTGAIVNTNVTNNKTNASAVADYDNDGFLDIVMANSNQNNTLYRNDGNSNHWLKINLTGTITNRAAIGARVSIYKTGLGWQYREVSAQTGYSSQNDLTVHFGLGGYTNVETVRIEWPSGIVQEYYNQLADQTLIISEEAPDTQVQSLNVSAGNVLQGETNYVLYNFLIKSNNSAYSNINTISFTSSSSGTYTVSDIQSNGFKLWYNANGNSFSSAVQIASASVVPPSSTIVFNLSNFSVPSGKIGYFWVTVDVSATAVIGNKLAINAPGATNIQAPNAVVSLACTNGNLHTIDDRPVIALNTPTITSSNVNANTNDVILYQADLTVTLNNTIITGLNFKTNNTYVLNDLKPNTFKLKYNSVNNFATAVEVSGSPQPIIATNNTLSFVFNQSINTGNTGYFWLTVDIADKTLATDGNKINITAMALTDVLYSRSALVTGTPSAGGVKTIVVTPDITLSAPAIAASNVNVGSVNQILYQLSASPLYANGVVTSIKFVSNGTYVVTDLIANSFKLWYNSSNNFGTASQLGTGQAIVSSGGNILFSGLSQNINNNSTGYFWLTTDIAAAGTAQDGHTIGINTMALADIVFTKGNKSGTLAAAGIQTISVNSSINLATLSLANSTVNAGVSKQVLYQMSINPLYSSTTLNGISLVSNGTYVNADLAANSFKLWYNTSNDLATAVQLGGAQPIISSGGTISFTGLSQGIAPNTTSYLWLTVDIASNTLATDGNTIGISAPTLSNIQFSSGTKNGLLSAGPILTIFVTPDITLSSGVLASNNINAGSNNNLLYPISIQPLLANTVLNTVKFKTAGTYTVSDLKNNCFKLWYSTNNNFGSAVQIGSAQSAVSSGGTIVFNGLTQSIQKNTTGYLWLTVDLGTTLKEGNTIYITQPTTSDFIFSKGVLSLNVSTGSTQTLFLSTFIMVNQLNLPDGFFDPGTKNVIIYQLSASVTGSNTLLNTIGFSCSGNYQIADLNSNGFQLWAGTSNDFNAANKVSSTGLVNTGTDIAFSGLTIPASANTVIYLWLTVDFNNNAKVGNNIQISSDITKLAFSKGSLSGQLDKCGSQTVKGVLPSSTNVSHEVLLPNLFSPNGDNQNDRFLLRSTNIQSVAIRVFDRLGNIVYQTSDITEATIYGWDGGTLPSGVYVWSAQVIFNDGYSSNSKGEIKLIR